MRVVELPLLNENEELEEVDNVPQILECIWQYYANGEVEATKSFHWNVDVLPEPVVKGLLLFIHLSVYVDDFLPVVSKSLPLYFVNEEPWIAEVNSKFVLVENIHRDMVWHEEVYLYFERPFDKADQMITFNLDLICV